MAINAQPRIDGAFAELIGPDTVFDLTHPLLPALFVTSPSVKSDSFENHYGDEIKHDMRLDLLVDYRLDALVDKRIGPYQQPNSQQDPHNNKAFFLPNVTRTLKD